jgi:hypothetical protein
MKFPLKLVHGETYRVRRVRLFDPTPQIGPWEDLRLYVQLDRHNTIVGVALLDIDGFAEFDPRYSYLKTPEGNHALNAEDYLLEFHGSVK